MGPSPILSEIQPITIDTMLNNNGLNIGDGLNFVTFEQTFTGVSCTSSLFVCDFSQRGTKKKVTDFVELFEGWRMRRYQRM